jgi:hypothetical protein
LRGRAQILFGKTALAPAVHLLNHLHPLLGVLVASENLVHLLLLFLGALHFEKLRQSLIRRYKILI